MATPSRFIFNFRTVFHRISNHSFAITRNTLRTLSKPPIIRRGGLLFAGGVIFSQADDRTATHKKSNKLKGVDPETLTSSYLIRNAASVSIDSASILLTQTATTLLQLHRQYVEHLVQLGRLQEMGVAAYGGGAQEDRIWDAVLVIRKKISDIKAAKHELEILYNSVERLMNNAAESAFLCGADDACTIANERLFAVQEKLNAAIEHSRKEEQALHQREAWVISETAQRDEELKAKAMSEPGIRLAGAEKDTADSSVGEVTQIPCEDPRMWGDTGSDADDWFTTLLGGENAEPTPHVDNAQNTNFTQEKEEEDERKWANAM